MGSFGYAGDGLITISQFVWSVWNETRYVQLDNIFMYGVATIGFGLAYIDLDLPQPYQYLHWIAPPFFVLLGLALICIRHSDTFRGNTKRFFKFFAEQDWRSLIVGGKTIALLEFAFLLPTMVGSIPSVIHITGWDVLDAAIICVIFSYVLTVLVYLYKNQKK